MTKRKLISLVLLLLAIAALYGMLLSLKVGATHADPPVPTPVSQLTTPPDVIELWKLTNTERAKVGAPPLALDERLNRSAQMKADEIHATRVFEHVGKDGKRGITYMQDVGFHCIGGGENLASADTSANAIDDWMGSPPHQTAMLRRETQSVGFGVSKGPGWSYVVAHYCQL